MVVIFASRDLLSKIQRLSVEASFEFVYVFLDFLKLLEETDKIDVLMILLQTIKEQLLFFSQDSSTFHSSWQHSGEVCLEYVDLVEI